MVSFMSQSPIYSSPIERQISSYSKPLKTIPMAIKKIDPGEMPLSPPVSPETSNLILKDTGILVEVPILTQVSPKSLEDAHYAPDYTMALEFRSRLKKAFGANPRKWAERELAQLKEDNRLRSGGRCRQKFQITKPPCKENSKIKKASVGRSMAMSDNTSTSRVNKARVRKNTRRGEIPERSKRVVREDKDFRSLPDYCPPLASLPNIANCLKVEWKGTGIGLSSDPFAHLLHSEELQLASNLRLDCATYLTSKRRIFISRTNAYKARKEFRKTDAQQACRIDVNKASKLWQAFEKVGWLEDRWVANYV
ncbi:putative swirm domain-containing protein [Erysiphe neolycopersici]|uniref:Putative swirm domain-containing protein n=1 Tax=Erysiphe neolycopersici TaxID=212602 RepID=A0A420HVR8_9PEZI|nr:putative swirm domain-containing protein [Erysiphe neolycopersici]